MTLIKNLVISSFEQPKPFAWRSFLLPFLALFLSVSAIGTVYWLGVTNQPAAAFWICLTLWLTVLIAGGALCLLSLGEQE